MIILIEYWFCREVIPQRHENTSDGMNNHRVNHMAQVMPNMAADVTTQTVNKNLRDLEKLEREIQVGE